MSERSQRVITPLRTLTSLDIVMKLYCLNNWSFFGLEYSSPFLRIGVPTLMSFLHYIRIKNQTVYSNGCPAVCCPTGKTILHGTKNSRSTASHVRRQMKSWKQYTMSSLTKSSNRMYPGEGQILTVFSLFVRLVQHLVRGFPRSYHYLYH